MTSSSLLCQQQAPHTLVRNRVTQTVQSIWHWRPQSLYHGRAQKPWRHTGVITSPVVFSLQKPGIEHRRKLHIRSSMVSLRAHKPAQTTNQRQKAAIQPPWWDKETQAAWTDKRTMVKLWQTKEASHTQT